MKPLQPASVAAANVLHTKTGAQCNGSTMLTTVGSEGRFQRPLYFYFRLETGPLTILTTLATLEKTSEKLAEFGVRYKIAGESVLNYG